MKLKQKGFTTLEMLLVLVIIAAVGFVGYYVYNSRQQTDKLLNSAQNEASAVKVTKTTVNSFADCQKSPGSIDQETYPVVCVTKSGQRFTQSTAQQYLTIKEWGVQLKLTENTSSLYYYIGTNDQNDAYLSLKTVSDIAPNCAADKSALAVIFRQTVKEHADALASPTDTNQPGSIKIGDYYYGYDHSHADCTDGTQAMQDAVNKAQPNVNLADTFQTIVAIPGT